MPKLDNDIYGLDDSGYATGIANKSLRSTKGDENFWGGTVDEKAVAKGSTPDPGEVKVRHLKEDTSGKKSEGN